MSKANRCKLENLIKEEMENNEDEKNKYSERSPESDINLRSKKSQKKTNRKRNKKG